MTPYLLRIGNFLIALCLILQSSNLFADVDIKVATLNIGMLNRIAPVSFWKEREGVSRKFFFDFLEKENVDILALQEVWTESIGNVLQDIHPDYEVVLLPQRTWLPVLGHATGLGFLVRKTC